MEVSQDAVVAQDGQQGPERGRGQAHADHDRVQHEVGGGEDRPDAQGEQERDHPGTAGAAQVPMAHGDQVELGPGQEHQVGQAEVGERTHHGVRVGQGQHVGADDDPQPDLDHDFGDGDEAPDALGDERSQDGGEPIRTRVGMAASTVMLRALAFLPSSPRPPGRTRYASLPGPVSDPTAPLAPAARTTLG